ncbi:PAS domain-containing protein [candidate division WOR-3 bacterium]|nr:PAS domain-containing protein [candidate division WOR-3 bacterium]
MSGPVRVLLVEDDPADALLVRERLADSADGISVVWVDTLGGAAARLAEGGIDAILLDLGLGATRGLETLHRMREVTTDVPIVVLTGMGDRLAGVEAIRRGAQDYLAKDRADGEMLARSLRYAVERARSETALSHTKVIADTVAEALALVDRRGRVSYVNPAFEKMSGLQSRVAVGMALADVARSLVRPEALGHALGLLERALRGEDVPATTVPFAGPDGQARMVELRVRVVRDGGGPQSQLVISALDITRRVDAEAGRHESDQRYRAIVARLPGGIVHIVDRELRYVYSAGRELTEAGIDPGRLAGRSIGDVLPLETVQVLAPQYRRALRGEAVQFEGNFSGRHFLVNAVPLPEPDGTVSEILVLAVNITQRKRAEEELQRAHDLLEQRVEERTAELARANKLKSDLVDMVMHDFGDPLWVVKGYAELLRDGAVGPLTGEQLETVGEMLRSVEALERLRADMLEVSRHERGRVVLECGEHDARELVDCCVAELGLLARRKSIELVVDVPPVAFECDQRRLRQAVINYLSNAIRYTPSAGRVRVSGREDGGRLELVVEDNGPGLSAEEVGRVFDDFYRGANRSAGSTGLGLAVVKLMVEAHGGEVWCDSEPGRGSRFGLRVPLRRPGEG